MNAKPTKFDSKRFLRHKEIDRSRLDDEMSEVSGLYGFYAEQAALWSSLVDHTKTQLEVKAAEIAVNLKRNGDEYDTKITDSYINAVIDADESYQKIKTTLNNCKEQKGLFDAAVSTIDKKCMALGSLRATARSELQFTR